MKRFILGLLLGVMLGTGISLAIAKVESGSSDAASIVGYGSTGTAIVKLKINSDGTLVVK